MPDVELVCLANSAKNSGRCVAGVTGEGEWIRPLGTGVAGAVMWNELNLDTGSEPALLDRIVVPLKTRAPDQYQPENWTIKRTQWRFNGHLDDDSARALLTQLRSRDPEIFRNRTDRIPQAELESNPADASLVIIRPAKFSLYYRSWNGSRRIRAEFVQAGQRYDLGMTDPVFKNRVGNHPDGESFSATAILPETTFFLCVSLGEPYRGDCYKMVAGVIALPND
jgi:hypothetical protein